MRRDAFVRNKNIGERILNAQYIARGGASSERRKMSYRPVSSPIRSGFEGRFKIAYFRLIPGFPAKQDFHGHVPGTPEVKSNLFPLRGPKLKGGMTKRFGPHYFIEGF
jgi:hypothetical protein